MDGLTLLILAVGLSMDAFAVAVSNGLCYGDHSIKYGWYTALAFGGAQGLMPILGYLAGQTFSSTIQGFDHWIALLLLGFIGGKMVLEGFGSSGGEVPLNHSEFSLKLLLVQAVATSIDALAVGISLAVMGANIWLAAASIGAVTFVCCVIGYLVGKKFGGMLQQKATIFGGFILIFLGLKIFIEHTFG